jgi:hypothetical protein
MGVSETVNEADLRPRTKDFIQYDSCTDRQVFYRVGIIDFLQKYNKRKQLETKWLTMRNRHVDPTTFSCVDPKLYGDRFHRFMVDNLFISQISYRESVMTPNAQLE